MRRPLTFLEEKQRERIEERAAKEVDWFFGVMGGRVPEPGVGPEYARPAAEAIDRWFRSIPPFHRGALALCHDTRPWPETLTKEFGGLTSLVVRLECARLADGTAKSSVEIESAAVRALEEDIAACERRRAAVQSARGSCVVTARERRVLRRLSRASKHRRLALRAYAKARGNAPCVLPRGVGVVDDLDLDDGGDE
jgi:hypothetical protein